MSPQEDEPDYGYLKIECQIIGGQSFERAVEVARTDASYRMVYLVNGLEISKRRWHMCMEYARADEQQTEGQRLR